MADETKTQNQGQQGQQGPGQQGGNSPAPASTAFKVGQYAILTETNPKTKATVTYLFLVTEVGTEDAVNVDKDGRTILLDKQFPDGKGGTVTRRVASTSKAPVYGGFAFNASQATPSPRQRVAATSLNPL